MGIIKRNVSAKPGRNRSAVTIIAEGNRFQGNTTISGKIHIDGQFDGEIDCSDDISVGKSGVVRGMVRAHQVSVSGLLEGELVCQTLRVERGGKVYANVACDSLIVDPDASFIGERKLLGDSGLTWESQTMALPSSLPLDDESVDDAEVIDIEASVFDSLPDKITLKR